MNKSLHFKNAALLAAFALNLSLVFGALARQTAAQTASATVSNNPNAIELSVTMQAVERKTNKTIADLTASDLRLFENGKEQRITRVEAETRPISLIVVAFIGLSVNDPIGDQDLLTGFRQSKRYFSFIGQILQQHLKAEDEVAIFVSDAKGQRVRGFSDSKTQLVNDLNAAFAVIEDKMVYEYGVTVPEENNNVLGAVEKAVQYFNESQAKDTRRVLLFLNNLVMVEKTTDAQRQELFENIISAQVVTNYIKARSLFSKVESLFPLDRFYPDRLGRFYKNLPEKTGGETLDFQRKDFNSETINYSSPEFAKLLEERGFTAFLDRLRTRYRIAYNSTDKTDKPREIRLELRGKKRAELHYQRRVIAPAQ